MFGLFLFSSGSSFLLPHSARQIFSLLLVLFSSLDVVVPVTGEGQPVSLIVVPLCYRGGGDVLPCGVGAAQGPPLLAGSGPPSGNYTSYNTYTHTHTHINISCHSVFVCVREHSTTLVQVWFPQTSVFVCLYVVGGVFGCLLYVYGCVQMPLLN